MMEATCNPYEGTGCSGGGSVWSDWERGSNGLYGYGIDNAEDLRNAMLSARAVEQRRSNALNAYHDRPPTKGNLASSKIERQAGLLSSVPKETQNKVIGGVIVLVVLWLLKKFLF